MNIDPSQATEAGLARAVAEKHAALWIEANWATLDSSNAYVEQHCRHWHHTANFMAAVPRKMLTDQSQSALDRSIEIASALDCLFQGV